MNSAAKLQALSLLGVLLTPLALVASDSAAIKAPLHSTGDPDAVGLVVATLRPQKSELVVRVGKLAPDHSYSIEVAGIVEGTVVTDHKGKGTARFATKAKNHVAAFDFDPRGQALRVLDDTTSVLEGVISGVGEDDGAVVDERAELEAQDDSNHSRAKARYTATLKGRRTFRVDISKLTGGPFKIFVSGIERGEITLRGKSGVALFDSSSTGPGAILLDFDPRGAVVDVMSNGTVVFSGKMEAKARGVNEASPSVSRVAIPSTGADPDGTASARLRIDDRARKHFSVEVEDVPAGSYDLLVDGAAVGAIHVAAVTGGTVGEIEFTNGDDDSTEIPLSFDPVGKTLTIAQGGTKFFEGLFDPNVTGSGIPGAEAPSQLDEFLTSTGLDADAKAEARYEVDNNGRHKFSVEIEEVDAGSYTLTVAGIDRGTIVAKLVTGTVKGEIEFESENEPGHRLLNFDPRGQTIEISSAAGILFSHLLGSGSATAGGGTTAPFDTKVPLISSGADADATATAEYQRKETGELSFEVELEDLDAGNYELLVGGAVRASVAVAAVSHGTRGKIRFEDAALDFKVPGQEIVVRQGGTQFFSRTFPNP